MCDARTAVAVGDSGMMIRTSDGGVTWIPEPSGTTNKLCSIMLIGANEGIVVGEGGTILGQAAGSVVVSVSRERDRTLPEDIALDQNYPNPFNSVTTIGFSVSRSGYTTLEVFDMLGRRVATLVNGNLDRGRHRTSLDAGRLASGVYCYCLRSAGIVVARNFLLLK